MPPHREPTISTHVLDNERGLPAPGVRVTLERRSGDAYLTLASEATDADGRIGRLVPGTLEVGVYRISFDVAAYFGERGGEVPFLRVVTLDFEIQDASRHYHVPLLLTRYACTSYRGS